MLRVAEAVSADLCNCRHECIGCDLRSTLDAFLEHGLECLLDLLQSLLNALFEMQQQQGTGRRDEQRIKVHAGFFRELFTDAGFDAKQVSSPDKLRLRTYEAENEVVVALLRFLDFSLFEYTHSYFPLCLLLLLLDICACFAVYREHSSFEHTDEGLEQV